MSDKDWVSMSQTETETKTKGFQNPYEDRRSKKS